VRQSGFERTTITLKLIKTDNTVRAGNLGQISTLTLDCGAIGLSSVLLQRGDWLILI
jgi:hypothetical protein